MKELILYMGSCRYMYNCKWSYFPPRLHTTKEILFFLENINNIENIINIYPPDLVDLIFSDIFHPGVIKDSKTFIIDYNKKYNISETYKEFILEISSRKIYYYNDIPLNHYNTNLYSYRIKKYKLKEKILTDDEIEEDLKKIIELSKKFHPNIKINIIPHLNLKLKSTKQYIKKRDELVKLLDKLCVKLNLKFINIGEFIENSLLNDVFLDEYMKDGRHYSSESVEKLIKKYLENNIINN